MNNRTIEFYVGIFMIVGIACSAYLLLELGELEVLKKDSYTVNAYFSSVAGLKQGAVIEMAGVEIGTVDSVSLDMERLLAKVVLRFRGEVILAEDVIASVKTSGIIGDKYITLSPGGSEVRLNPGDTIFNTESAIDIESLVSKYIFGQKEE